MMAEHFDPEEFFRQEDEDAACGSYSNGHDRAALVPIDPSTLASVPVPPRHSLVPDWVPMARATALYGPPGDGKTLLGQMLATCCSVNALWLGMHVLQCRSLLLFCEDDLDEMQRRQEAINDAFGCTFADLGAMRWLPRLGDDNALMTPDGRHTRLFDEVLATAKAHGAQLIITDTLADVFAGNENDRSQARGFAQQALGRLARETQGAVITLAHPSRAGMSSGSGESGSTAWVGTFRSQLYLSTPRSDGDAEPLDPDLRVLTRRKSNAARRNETIEMRWKDGVFVTTAPPDGIIGSIQRRTCERVFLDLLDRMTDEGQHVSHKPKAGDYAPRIFSKRPERERFAKGDFERAMHTLMAARKIIIATYKDAHRRSIECLLRVAEKGQQC